MPKQTFKNLNPAKQERFYKAALAEFSSKGYHQASITQIVKKLDIAKGSIYQYFDDKFDLHQYLLFSSHEKLNEIRSLIDRSFDGDLSQWFINRCLGEIKFLRQFPEENELILKVMSDRSGDLASLRNNITAQDKQAIADILRKTRGENISTWAFTLEATKRQYLSTYDAEKPIENALQDLEDISQILFVTSVS